MRNGIRPRPLGIRVRFTQPDWRFSSARSSLLIIADQRAAYHGTATKVGAQAAPRNIGQERHAVARPASSVRSDMFIAAWSLDATKLRRSGMKTGTGT